MCRREIGKLIRVSIHNKGKVSTPEDLCLFKRAPDACSRFTYKHFTVFQVGEMKSRSTGHSIGFPTNSSSFLRLNGPHPDILLVPETTTGLINYVSDL